MTGLLICAAVVGVVGGGLCFASGCSDNTPDLRLNAAGGLALIAAALYLAWRAGGAG